MPKNNLSTIKTFGDILAPITADEFFAEYYDKQPLHVTGDQDKFDPVMSWPVLEDLLNMTGIWSANSLALVQDRKTIPPRAYCEETAGLGGGSVLRPDAAKVMRHLRQGASLVANDIDSLTGPLRALSALFEDAYSAKAQVNLYCSWPQRQAFDSHFDTHDVFALHIAGRKTWRIYETRVPRPIRHTRFTSLTAEEHASNRGKLLKEVEMTPGDVLYLPRGWYHDALADTDGGTIHLTFGLTSVIGMDVLGAISDLLVDEELFRRNLPRPEEGAQAMSGHIRDLASAMRRIAERPELAEMMAGFQAAYRYNRGGIELPIETEDPGFTLTGKNYKLSMRNGAPVLLTDKGATSVPASIEPLLRWTLEHRTFGRSALIAAFPQLPVSELDQFITDLVAMGQLAPR